MGEFSDLMMLLNTVVLGLVGRWLVGHLKRVRASAGADLLRSLVAEVAPSQDPKSPTESQQVQAKAGRLLMDEFGRVVANTTRQEVGKSEARVLRRVAEVELMLHDLRHQLDEATGDLASHSVRIRGVEEITSGVFDIPPGTPTTVEDLNTSPEGIPR
jgi:hypothetical protein